MWSGATFTTSSAEGKRDCPDDAGDPEQENKRHKADDNELMFIQVDEQCFSDFAVDGVEVTCMANKPFDRQLKWGNIPSF